MRSSVGVDFCHQNHVLDNKESDGDYICNITLPLMQIILFIYTSFLEAPMIYFGIQNSCVMQIAILIILNVYVIYVISIC